MISKQEHLKQIIYNDCTSFFLVEKNLQNDFTI